MPFEKKPQAEPVPGYRLLAPLGRGGFGEVWKCQAPGGLVKAIKFVEGPQDPLDKYAPADDEWHAIERIKDIRHPFLLAMDRVERVGDELVIVMELADRNLADRCDECRRRGQPGIPRDELLGYLLEAAEVLDLMNFQYDLQHLDVKPQNLFLVCNHVKVADFGLVNSLGDALVAPGAFTPLYAAPETFRGIISPHCDQYSLAIVYQELLTGSLPFPGKNARQLLLQHTHDEPDLTAVPPSDRLAVARALSKEPQQRYPSCTAFVRALALGSDAEHAAEPGASEWEPPWPGPYPPRLKATTLNAHVADTPGSRDARTPGTIRFAELMGDSGCPRSYQRAGERETLRARHHVRLAEVLVRQKAEECRQMWNGQLLRNEPGLYVFTVSKTLGFWQRWLGRQAGLAMTLRLTPTREGTDTTVEVEPFGCDREEGVKLVAGAGPLLLDSLATALQGTPERRSQERVVWHYPLWVRFLLDNHQLSDPVACCGKDISPTGMGFYLPAGMPMSRVILTLATPAQDGKLEVPARIVRAQRCNEDWYEVGAQFLLDEGEFTSETVVTPVICKRADG